MTKVHPSLVHSGPSGC